MIKGWLLSLGIVVSVSCGAAEVQTVTFQSLLGEMVDIGTLAEYPEPAYVGKQASSFDRRSTDPAIGTEENWFANQDCGVYVGSEEIDGEPRNILMDVEGPGAIVRIWSANPHGILRIYLDGATEPTLEFDFAKKFEKAKGTTLETLIGIRSKGANIFFPIPYAKSCKVTTTADQMFYHVNYRTYAADVVVESFTPSMTEEFDAEIKEVAEKLAAPEKLRTILGDEKVQGFSKSLAPSKGWTFTVKGPRAISEFACKLEAEDIKKALRGSLLRIYFDGQQQPLVECPLGDFFGSAPGVNPYKSLPFGVYPDGLMVCHYLMPFQQEARFEIVNLTDQPMNISGQVISGQYEWSDRSMYFHANWQTRIDAPTRPQWDWNWIDAQGQGVFVGAMLDIMNPAIVWWGEGDEKIYIDGEDFPSTFGTGTEDYFGYAWSWFTEFEHAYHNQPHCDRPGNLGHSSLNRFHFLDALPFTESIRFDMEIWHHIDVKVTLAETTYWYAKPGATHRFPAIDPQEMIVKPSPEPMVIAGAIEGEAMEVLSISNGAITDDFSGEILDPLSIFTAIQTGWSGAGWSGHASRFWYRIKEGDVLELGFDVPKAGKYEVSYCGMKGDIFSNVKMGINGGETPVVGAFKLAEAIEWDAHVAHVDRFELGVFDLKSKGNVLKVEILPSDGLKSHLFALDCLVINPVE